MFDASNRQRFWQAHLESLQKSEEESPANVLIKYLVPPPVSEEFIEVFKSVKDGDYLVHSLFASSLRYPVTRLRSLISLPLRSVSFQLP